MLESHTTESRTRCLTDLFDQKGGGVLIPIVQRDYAQGRPGAEEVRERFLGALYNAIDKAGEGVPALDLDFVYGYPEKDSGRFVPIDGQQRLTTLFLLHWFLSHVDGEQAHFRSWAVLGESSRFQYAVRTSSDDFLRELIQAPLDFAELLPSDRGQHNALSKTIRNEHWYFRSWELDPTVRACLTMLDCIHAKFGETSGFYRRLLQPRPAITFQYLDLESFGLGDELYIKMNARGRPLTEFEVFKSEVEKYARSRPSLVAERLGPEGLPMPNYLGRQLDTSWSHLVWTLLQSEHQAVEGTAQTAEDEDAWTRRLDPQLFNLMRTLTIVMYQNLDAPGDGDKANETALEELHNGWVTSFPGYAKRAAVSEEWVRAVIKLMDLWSGDTDGRPESALNTVLHRRDYYDEAAMFKTIREDKPRPERADVKRKPEGAATYTDVVRFAAYCLFLLSDHDRAGLDDWMRVTSNLARNSIISGGDSLRRALRGLRTMLSSMQGNIVDHLAQGGKAEGFSRQQLREERLKAQLIRKHSEWRHLIERAELHRYFQGQIEFLFVFSGIGDAWRPKEKADWSADADESHRAAFLLSMKRAEAVFAHARGGLAKLPDFVWQRALLCFGDYLLRMSPGSRKWSFGVNAADNDVSWKRLLRGDFDADGRVSQRRQYMADLFDCIDPEDLEGSLRKVIAAGVRGDEEDQEWRTIVVSTPQMLRYCTRDWMIWEWSQDHERDEGAYQAYLVAKSKRGPFHDVYTWHFHGLLEKAREEGRLEPFTRIVLVEGSGSAVTPHIALFLKGKKFPSYRVYHYADHFYVWKVKGRRQEKEFDCKRSKLLKKLRKLGKSLKDTDE